MDLFYLTNFLVWSINKSWVPAPQPRGDEEASIHMVPKNSKKTWKSLCISATCWPGAVDVWLLHVNLSILILLSWVQDGHQLADVFLLSSSYQSQTAGNSGNTLAYHSTGPRCSGSNQTIKFRAAKDQKSYYNWKYSKFLSPTARIPLSWRTILGQVLQAHTPIFWLHLFPLSLPEQMWESRAVTHTPDQIEEVDVQ